MTDNRELTVLTNPGGPVKLLIIIEFHRSTVLSLEPRALKMISNGDALLR